MSDVMLRGILRIPPQMWSGDEFDSRLRHSAYCEAATELERRQGEIDRLQQIVQTLHQRCDREMGDMTQGPSESLGKIWDHVTHAATEAGVL